MIKQLDDLFDYDTETGELIHRRRDTGPRNWNSRYAGKRVTCVNAGGYVVFSKKGKTIYAHRYVYEAINGPLPSGVVIDHINGDTTDNRIDNLRPVTHDVNCRNKRKSTRNKTGFTGVHEKDGRFIAQMKINNHNYHLGVFSTADAAGEYVRYCRSFFDFTERHGE